MNIFEPIDQQEKFKRLTENATEEEKRKTERSLLKPEPLPAYNGMNPKHKSDLDTRVVIIVFSSDKEMELVGRHFTISESAKGEKYITDISKLVDYCAHIEYVTSGEGEVTVNAEKTPEEIERDKFDDCVQFKKGGGYFLVDPKTEKIVGTSSLGAIDGVPVVKKKKYKHLLNAYMKRNDEINEPYEKPKKIKRRKLP